MFTYVQQMKGILSIMKKSITLVLVLSFLLGLCACSSAPQPTSVPASATETVKTGTVLEASMHTLSITAPDGTTYSFITDDSTETIGDGLCVGDTVSVAFDGDYKENILAKKVTIDQKAAPETPAPSVQWDEEQKTDSAEEETPPEAAQPETNSSGASPDDVLEFITGTVMDVSMNSIVIECDGQEFSIQKDENTQSDSVFIGDMVRVYYKENSGDGMTATSIVKQ